MLVKMFGERGNRVAVVDSTRHGYGFCVDQEITTDGFIRRYDSLTKEEALRMADEIQKGW